MRGRRRSRRGIARAYALVFGTAYLAVAVLEDILGKKGLKVAGHFVLTLTAAQNAIHWVVGVAAIGSFFAGEVAAKAVARVIGVVFVVVTAYGVLARQSLGKLLGFPGPLPWAYNLIHLVTAVAALVAGFGASRVYGRRRGVYGRRR